MNEDEFKEKYIAAFLGARGAINYDRATSSGNFLCYEYQPVEDAKLLANLAWKSLVEAGMNK
jgi:hypothetical protein